MRAPSDQPRPLCVRLAPTHAQFTRDGLAITKWGSVRVVERTHLTRRVATVLHEKGARLTPGAPLPPLTLTLSTREGVDLYEWGSATVTLSTREGVDLYEWGSATVTLNTREGVDLYEWGSVRADPQEWGR